MATVFVAAALLLPATAAAAEGDPDGGLWYYNGPDFDRLHQQSTGEGITIGVIDTFIDPTVPDLAGTNLTVHEPSYCALNKKNPDKSLPAASSGAKAVHGTRMTSIILGTGKGLHGHPGTKGIAPGAKVIHYGIGADDKTLTCAPTLGDEAAVAAAIDQAIADHVDIISMSFTTQFAYYIDSVARALHAGIILVAAASDQASAIVGSPADLNGVVAVDSLTPAGTTPKENDVSSDLDVVAPGEQFNLLDKTLTGYSLVSGSSNATAYTAGVLALVWSKYPKANANQILWDLAYNTDGSDHPFQRNDVTGFGVVNARRMLAHDPTQYPADVSPMVSQDNKYPPVAEIANPPAAGTVWDPHAVPTATAAPTEVAPASTAVAAATPAPTAVAGGGRTGAGPAALVGGGIAALVLVGGIVAGLLVARRRAGSPGPAPARPNLAEGTSDV